MASDGVLRHVPAGDLPPLLLLRNAVRAYAWGSRTAIADIQGRPTPAPTPEAELWVGAHPSDPSLVRLAGGDEVRLDDLIATRPGAVLGDRLRARVGERLPFLLKLLAAEAPLSLQAHPSASQAAAGFAAEEARGVPIDAPQRVYRDPWPKPELLCALTPFHAFCGFRPTHEAAATLRRLDVPALEGLSERLVTDGDAALRPVIAAVLRWPAADRGSLVAAVRAGAERLAAAGDVDADRAEWTVRLATVYPHDPGVVVSLLLHLVELRPGEAIHLGPGELHSYLRGTAVEVMACSDNVLRGGLTAKHVDVTGLLDVLAARSTPPPRVRAVPGAPGELVYPAPTSAFRLSRLQPSGGSVELDDRGPELLLVVDGVVTVEADGQPTELGAGSAALIPAATTRVSVRGAGVAFRATVGDPDAAGGGGSGR